MPADTMFVIAAVISVFAFFGFVVTFVDMTWQPRKTVSTEVQASPVVAERAASSDHRKAA